MIIVKIKAGLGNQMFQYACGRALALRNNDTLKLDITDWSLNKEQTRKYLLSSFNINAGVATEKDLGTLKYPNGVFINRVINKVKSKLGITNVSFSPKIFTKKGDAYLDGFWQSEKYFVDFADQICMDFTLKNPLSNNASRSLSTIEADDLSVSLQIRRGDNAYNPSSIKTFGCPGIKYYQSCIKTLVDNLKQSNQFKGKINIYVFSDEIGWAKENLHLEFPTIFISRPEIELCEELSLMRSCKHNIISNSTFGWWGAWLNQNANKIVIAPKQWALKRQKNYKDLIPEKWIRI